MAKTKEERSEAQRLAKRRSRAELNTASTITTKEEKYYVQTRSID